MLLQKSVLDPCEISVQKVKRFLSKKMKVNWSNVLPVNYLESISCLASLDRFQKVISFDSSRYQQIVLNAPVQPPSITARNLSFATLFIVVVLFIFHGSV